MALQCTLERGGSKCQAWVTGSPLCGGMQSLDWALPEVQDARWRRMESRLRDLFVIYTVYTHLSPGARTGCPGSPTKCLRFPLLGPLPRWLPLAGKKRPGRGGAVMHKGACLLQGSPPFPSALRLARQCARAGRRLEVALELCLRGSCARLCCQTSLGWGGVRPAPFLCRDRPQGISGRGNPLCICQFHSMAIL